MKTHSPKLKTTPRPLFSCGFFRHCTQTPLSPTPSSHPAPPLPLPPPPPPPPPPPESSSSSSSSSTSTSQSFTLWKFPIPSSPILPHAATPPESHALPHSSAAPTPDHPIDLNELFHLAELQLSAGSDSDRVSALHLLERCLLPNPPADAPPCPPAVMAGVIGHLRDTAGAKPATKVLLALCLAEGNRRVAVEAGAVGAVVEAAPDLDGAAAERALAALELMCTVEEGAAEVRAHALAVPMMVEVMGRTAARGREYAIGVLAVIFGGGEREDVHAPPEEVARAVALALRGDCSARGKRKGAQLLKMLEENGRQDIGQGGNIDA